MMRKHFFFFIFFSACEITHAQYLIPGASQQPAWVFPIWIEDAYGQQDILYFGYDSLANQFIGPGYIEDQYGEHFEVVDTIGNLQCWTWYTTFTNTPDSIIKVDIRNSFEFPFILGVINVHMPIILRWDVVLLRNDSLPFPDNLPAPRAQLNVDWYYLSNSIPCFPNDKVLITDSVIPGAYCWFKDSLIINHNIGDSGLTSSYFELNFKPWEGIIYTGINTHTLPSNLLISNNPTHSGKFILSGMEANSEILVYHINGSLCERYKCRDSSKLIDLSNYNKGIYVLKIIDRQNIFIRKIYFIE